MSDLKPIGSEKLQGDEKIKRIIEIANFKNSNINESNKNSEYSKLLSDGNQYHIVKEKNGYIIKSMTNENVIDYREPIQERKYYSSYSQALKRLNLIAKELNEKYNNDKGVSLFLEDTKYVLKQKNTSLPAEDLPEVENVPPPPPMDDMGMTGDNMGVTDSDIPTPDMGSEELPEPPSDSLSDGNEDMGMDDSDSSSPGSFRLVQKLLGKVTQKMRDLQDEDKLTDKNIKYVINTILSAVDLNKLSQEDKDDIIAKFEEEDMEDMDLGNDEDFNMGNEMPDEDLNATEEEPMGEMEESGYPDLASRVAMNSVGQMMKKSMGYSPKERVQSIMDGMFTESKVDELLTKYFKVNKNEKNFINEKNKNKKIDEIERLCESEVQKTKGVSLVENFQTVKFIGKTNKGNLVFENNGKQIKLSKSGKFHA